jgi:5S rRNA maturation endonuclease (ribonuclease M5)
MGSVEVISKDMINRIEKKAVRYFWDYQTFIEKNTVESDDRSLTITEINNNKWKKSMEHQGDVPSPLERKSPGEHYPS